MSTIYLGVDIGGTAVKLGLVDETGGVLRRAERSVSFDGYRTPIIDTVQRAIRDFWLRTHQSLRASACPPPGRSTAAAAWSRGPAAISRGGSVLT